MSNAVISVENLSKIYRLGQIGTGTFKNDLKVWFARVRRRPNPLLKIGQEDHGNRAGEDIWALKDVSFTVEQGRVLGIIGRNGAGKSTLLKILSRITAPSAGQVKMKGRIASLLEVGTGFHPELTGRENIFLNGAILGMTRDEVTRKFEEIVSFSEVERFIDTPIKRYSSGMYVRLAFAVAAHLESEILLVDEVLAVGDSEFQKKCLGKIGDVASKEGRTVLFVSHNMASIENLCPYSILFSKGRITLYDMSSKVIPLYLSGDKENSNYVISDYRPEWANPYIYKIEVMNTDNQINTTFRLGENIKFRVYFECINDYRLSKPVLGLVVNHKMHGVIGGINMRMTGFSYTRDHYEKGFIECVILDPPLLQGQYSVDFWLGDGPTDVDAIFGFAKFSVEDADVYGTGKVPFSNLGVIFLNSSWKISNYE